MDVSTILLTLILVWAFGGFEKQEQQDLLYYDESIEDLESQLLELSDRISKLEK